MTAPISGPWRWVKTHHGAGHVVDDLVCTMPVVEWSHGDDGDEDFHPLPPRECGTEIIVTWSFSVPVVPDETVGRHDVATAAISSSWDASCIDGHVVASSANQWSTADDAEWFDPAVVFGVPS